MQYYKMIEAGTKVLFLAKKYPIQAPSFLLL
jgi:hypothetical protein